jgi:hypothetical protein
MMTKIAVATPLETKPKPPEETEPPALEEMVSILWEIQKAHGWTGEAALKLHNEDTGPDPRMFKVDKSKSQKK